MSEIIMENTSYMVKQLIWIDLDQIHKNKLVNNMILYGKNIIVDNFAPVIIPTLCRYEHFKECLESLSRCTWAEKTEVYIGLDYP